MSRTFDEDVNPLSSEYLTELGFDLICDIADFRRWKLILCRQDLGFGDGVTTHWLIVHEPIETVDGGMWWPIDFCQQHSDEDEPDAVALLSYVDHTTCGHLRKLVDALAVHSAEMVS